ncbi:hypothetical protein BC941DRAFT_476865 [Chlamydoabsidia padenii]|nr:hypothetical protein BC941DRAFT_476865 [Chlamydoabsidia padenii]
MKKPTNITDREAMISDIARQSSTKSNQSNGKQKKGRSRFTLKAYSWASKAMMKVPYVPGTFMGSTVFYGNSGKGYQSRIKGYGRRSTEILQQLVKNKANLL